MRKNQRRSDWQTLPAIEPPNRLECFRVQLDGRVSGKHPGAAAGIFLGGTIVRCAIGTQEKSWVAAGRRVEQRKAVAFALQDRQAVVVRPDAAGEYRVAIVQQVLGRDGRADAGSGAGDEFDGARRRDVFEDHAQGGKTFEHGLQHGVDEVGFTVEYIHVACGVSPCTSKGMPSFLHALENSIHMRDVGHAGIRVRGGTGRV